MMGGTASEKRYIRKRLLTAWFQSIPFYFFRIFPIKSRKVVFTTIEGTTGFTCNPKYIALELIKRNKACPPESQWELVWLVNDSTKIFPDEIRKIKNTLLNRAYHLTTARFWIDNSRKQLECRKRRRQIYIQTWHAKLGFKPTCLDRGASFSRIAYLVSKHDSDMVDCWLSNSDWYDQTLKTGSLYEGKSLRSGSPRCDILINRTAADCTKVRERLGLKEDTRLLMFAPTFRGGSQSTDRTVRAENEKEINFDKLVLALERRFGGEWHILLRLHPQLAARHIESGVQNKRLIDISKVDDMYEILAGCDAFLTDYSSAAFDAAVMRIPVLLYCDDYSEYEDERGKLLWNLRNLPFPLAETTEELEHNIENFDKDEYEKKLDALFTETGMTEDGNAASRVADFLEQLDKKAVVSSAN